MMAIECSISDLPEEILVHIFSFYVSSAGHSKLLRNISTVCEKWSEVCKLPSLWKSVDDPLLTTAELVELSERGVLRNTTKLNLGHMKMSPEYYEKLFEIIGNCDSLQYLEMSGSKVMEQMTSHVAEKCKDLKYLKLDDKDIPILRVSPEPDVQTMFRATNRSSHSFIEACQSNYIDSLSPSSFLPTDNNLLSRVSNQFHHLEELNVSFNTDKLVVDVSDFQKGCPKLRVLKISNCEFNCSRENATNGFPHLEVFESNTCWLLGDAEIYQLLRKSTNLHTLGVNGSMVSCEGLLKIPAENIERLDVSKAYGVFSGEIEKVISRWKFTLKELDISDMDDEPQVYFALHALWENDFCPPLEVLNLSSSGVSFLTLQILLDKCKSLRYLDLEFCIGLHILDRKIYKRTEDFEVLKFCLKSRRAYEGIVRQKLNNRCIFPRR